MRLIYLFLLAIPLNAYSVDVTFRLNMNGFEGFNTPEVNGTFNGWCGSCNAMSDPDEDGIWETTVNIPQGNIQYKFSFDNWSGQENLQSAYCANGSNNRTFIVPESALVLDVVCWGLCAGCLSPDESAWNLVWAEEFLGNSLNMDTWNFDLGDHGWGNNEWQNYTNSPLNHQVSAGSLKITARHQGGENYSSARITTRNKFEFQYGKVEARIKVPIGQGIWPAFWMLGANFQAVGWPQCGEIDIMEHVNNEPLTHAAKHWNLPGHTYETSNMPFQVNEFHKYGLIWNEVGVTYLVNDRPFFYLPFSENDNTAAIFQKPFYFLLNVAVGGNWPGYPDGTATFPATMEVQNIRVYEPNTLSASANEAADLTRIYPLPAKDNLNIDFGDVSLGRQVFIFNTAGQMFHSAFANGHMLQIDTRSWSAGLYIVQVWNENGEISSYKIVKH
jgi:beta-glucanase (GH16 family)